MRRSRDYYRKLAAWKEDRRVRMEASFRLSVEKDLKRAYREEKKKYCKRDNRVVTQVAAHLMYVQKFAWVGQHDFNIDLLALTMYLFGENESRFPSSTIILFLYFEACAMCRQRISVQKVRRMINRVHPLLCIDSEE